MFVFVSICGWPLASSQRPPSRPPLRSSSRIHKSNPLAQRYIFESTTTTLIHPCCRRRRRRCTPMHARPAPMNDPSDWILPTETTSLQQPLRPSAATEPLTLPPLPLRSHSSSNVGYGQSNPRHPHPGDKKCSVCVWVSRTRSIGALHVCVCVFFTVIIHVSVYDKRHWTICAISTLYTQVWHLNPHRQQQLQQKNRKLVHTHYFSSVCGG